jgi:hypothetical protein
MLIRRRLTALVAAVSFVGASLALGVVTPAARAAEVPTTAERAPHDPATYYAGTAGLSGATLAAKLNTIIKGHTALSYTQVYDYLPITDANPDRPGYLVDFYSGTDILASNRCGSSCPIGSWNREHTWPQSHGGFGTSATPTPRGATRTSTTAERRRCPTAPTAGAPARRSSRGPR